MDDEPADEPMFSLERVLCMLIVLIFAFGIPYAAYVLATAPPRH